MAEQQRVAGSLFRYQRLSTENLGRYCFENRSRLSTSEKRVIVVISASSSEFRIDNVGLLLCIAE